jgi:hypothetical protein
MSDVEQRFHETWLGMIQPVEGLVVSVPVLVQAQCAERLVPDAQRRLLAIASVADDGAPSIKDVRQLLRGLLGYGDESITRDDLDAHSLYVPEGPQVIGPTCALRDPSVPRRHLVLIWELRDGLDLDRPEVETGAFHYPPTAKFDRLLRHAGVPIGLLANGRAFRLVYAPPGEASGHLTFRLDEMLSVGGRPILDAFVMLLSAHRLFGVAPERTLSRLLEDSRRWQGRVSERLAGQVLEAAGLLLDGLQDAAHRDRDTSIADAVVADGDHVHRGILAALLRIVFLLYAEDSGLMPVENRTYRSAFSVLTLFEELRADAGSYPDSMANRFGAWGRLISAFRAVFLGVAHQDLILPPRRGTLFDPHRFPFLEGWGPAGSAPIADAEERARVAVPTVSDATVLAILEHLLVLEGQRISYRSLDVEQIGGVYESMLGYTVVGLGGDAICLRGSRKWVVVDDLLGVPIARRARWFKDEAGLSSSAAERLARDLEGARGGADVLDVLRTVAAKGADGQPLARRRATLVIQPRGTIDTSTAHYTPRSLCRPLVARALDPLLRALGAEPSAAQILSLKVCDPAMGSGAFLVEACRFLAEHVLAAWRREGHVPAAGDAHDPLVLARRVVAQRCLYGVDRNADAVELAKLSLWLVTLARELPFTFIDHALRHGDSIVGLDIDQLASFHWKAGTADIVISQELSASLAEARPIRMRIANLAAADAPDVQAEKQRLLWDAEDAIERLRTVADLVLAAYFRGSTGAEREALRVHYRDAVVAWLQSEAPLPPDVVEARTEFRLSIPAFHWMLEMPEVFDAERIEPLDPAAPTSSARMDAFAGNMPFIGGRRIATVHGERYAKWLCDAFESSGEVDYVTYFFLRANELLGTTGTIGFIATNSISQGDTRRVGLHRLLSEGLVLYDAQNKVPWPGDAGVLVAPIVLAKGASCGVVGTPHLNGMEVSTINSRLRSYAERDDPQVLGTNAGVALVGCFLRGDGFVLSPDEASHLLKADQEQKAIVRPYLVGEDIAKDPLQRASRFVVDFGVMELEAAREHARAMAIVEERVRPDRERLRSSGADAAHRRFWWRFANPRVDLRAWLSKNISCLVLPRVAKHLLVARAAADQVFSEQVVIFTLDSMTGFATLQSRVHEAWVRLLTSTMGEGLRYSATDCFDTFPFPETDPRQVVDSIESIGCRLERARARYMVDESVGLTTTYNRLKEPACDDARILELRRFHEEMDLKVLESYAERDPEGRWLEVGVPPFCPMNDADKDMLSKFEDAVIDRLFVLNAKRAKAQEINGAVGNKKEAGKEAASRSASIANGEKKPRGRKKTGADQCRLTGDDGD